MLGDLDDLADVADDDVPGVHAHLLGQLGVNLQVALFAVNRDKESGLDQGVDDLQLVLAGVAGDVERPGPLIDHLGPFAVELVDDVVDGVFVAGDGGGGEDDPVSGLDVHLLVGGEGDPGEGGHGLALAAGGDDAHLVLGQALDVVDVHQSALRDAHIAQLSGDLQGVLHAPAGDGHLPAVLGGHGDDLLDAVHIGGKGGDDDALVTAPEEGVKGGAHAPLALGVPRPLHVGGVAQQGQDPLLAHDGGLDGEGHGVGNGVVDVDELHRELARLHHLAGLAGNELGLVQEPVLLQLQLYQAGGHTGGVDGGVDAAQQVGDGADVVLVAVGEEDAPDLVLVLDEIGEVGDDHIDAVHVVVGEAHAHIDNDDIAAVLIYRQILADLIESAQRDDLQFFCHKSMLTLLFQSMDGRDAGIGAQQNKARDPPRAFRPCLAGKRGRSPAGSRDAQSCFCLISRCRST